MRRGVKVSIVAHTKKYIIATYAAGVRDLQIFIIIYRRSEVRDRLFLDASHLKSLAAPEAGRLEGKSA